MGVYGHRVWGTCNNRTMVPHKEIQWSSGTPQGKFYRLATKEKTIKYPTSAMCRVSVRVEMGGVGMGVGMGGGGNGWWGIGRWAS